MKNITEKELLMDESLRNDVINEMGNNLRESTIWNIGTKFETTAINYMTINQISILFNTNKDNIKNYLREIRNGKENEYLNELKEAGVIKVNKEEFEKIVEKINWGLKDPSQNNTNELRFYSEFTILFPLEAVCKLGMFMTGTPKAIEFRNRIIDNLKLEVAKTEDIKNLTKNTFEILKESATESAIPNLPYAKKYIDEAFKAAKKVNYRFYKDMNEQLKELENLYSKLLDNLKKKDDDILDEIDKMEHDEKKDRCRSFVKIFLTRRNKNLEEIERITLASLDTFGTLIDTTLTDILRERNISVKTSNVNKYKEKLVELGIFVKTHPIAKNNKYGLDSNGEKIILRNKGEINTDVTNYIPSEKYSWLTAGKYSKITMDGTSQKFEFSECGKEFIVNALFNDKIFETEEEFKEYILNKIA